MIGYKDRTFCPFHDTCANPCDRALTEQVKTDAKKWWGNDDAPIYQFTNKPRCWKRKE